jgi:hypothetical protein
MNTEPAISGDTNRLPITDNPLNQKLRAYLVARPHATEKQLTEYLAFHVGVPYHEAQAVVSAYLGALPKQG